MRARGFLSVGWAVGAESGLRRSGRCRLVAGDGVGDVLQRRDDGARVRRASTKRSAASTFGPMLPLANWPAAACSRISATVTRPSGRAYGVPKPMMTFSTSVAMTRVSAPRSRASIAAVRSLSMTASTPRRRAVAAVVASPGCRRRRRRRRRSRRRPGRGSPGRRRRTSARARRRPGASPSRRGPPRSGRARRTVPPPRAAGSGRPAWSARGSRGRRRRPACG